MKKTLSWVLSLVMILTALTAMPFSVAAEGDTQSAHSYPQGSIIIMDEFASWGINTDDDSIDIYDYQANGITTKTAKGISYNVGTNTLTFNNVPQVINCYMLVISDMGDLTINLVGDSALGRLEVLNTNIAFTGSGTLTMNPPLTWYIDESTHGENERLFEESVFGLNAAITIANTATVILDNNATASRCAVLTFESPMQEDKVIQYEGNVSAPLNWEYE